MLAAGTAHVRVPSLAAGEASFKPKVSWTKVLGTSSSTNNVS